MVSRGKQKGGSPQQQEGGDKAHPPGHKQRPQDRAPGAVPREADESLGDLDKDIESAANPLFADTAVSDVQIVPDLDIQIDPELKSYIPPPTDEELAQLEEQLRRDGGCRDAIVVWEETKTLLDGHNRLELCRKLGLPVSVRKVSLPDREAAKDWMAQNQLGRRNLSPDVFSYFLGRLYESLKRQGKRTDLTSGQSAQKSTTAEELAAQHGLDEKTIRRHAEFALHLDTLAENTGSEIRQKVFSRKVKLSRADIKELAGKRPSDQKAIIPEVLAKGRWEKPKPARPAPPEGFLKAWKRLKEEAHRREALRGLLADPEAGTLLEEIQSELAEEGQEVADSEEYEDEEQGSEEQEDAPEEQEE